LPMHLTLTEWSTGNVVPSTTGLATTSRRKVTKQHSTILLLWPNGCAPWIRDGAADFVVTADGKLRRPALLTPGG
jgi:hypothetical protein